MNDIRRVWLELAGMLPRDAYACMLSVQVAGMLPRDAYACMLPVQVAGTLARDAYACKLQVQAADVGQVQAKDYCSLTCLHMNDILNGYQLVNHL